MKTGKVVRTLSLLLAMLMLAGMIPAAFATEKTGNEIQEAAAGVQPVAESASGEEEETSESEDGSVIVYRAFDVSLQKDGQEVAAEGEFRVTVETGLDAGSLIPEDTECVGTGCRLYHVHEGKADIVKDAEMDDDGFLTFTTPNFSTFLLEYKVNYKTITRDFITASGETYTITVTYEDNALIPEDAELDVREILPETEEFEDYMAQSAEKLGVEINDVSFARFFDIEIVKDGEKIEPEVPVQVKIAYKDAVEIADGETLSVVHFAEVGEKSGPEVITDITLNDSKTELTYQQTSFSVTGTVVTTPQENHNYALIIHHTDNNYYVVRHDGTLTKLDAEDVVIENGTIQSVKMINPIFWTYTRMGNDGGNCKLWHDTDAWAYDVPGTSLPTRYTRRYLNVDVDDGYADLNNYNHGSWDENVVDYQVNEHLLQHYGNYLSVVQDQDGTLRIRGGNSGEPAAELYLVEAQLVPDVNVYNHTVNHIDISIEGSAGISVPLAYGTYTLAKLEPGYLENLDNLSDAEIMAHITETQEMTVSYGNDYDAEEDRLVEITEDDIKKAKITAFVIGENNTIIEKDDVYKVTGYSGNAVTNQNRPQVRLEGSFKVSDMEPVTYANSEDAANYWNYYENGVDTGKQIRTVRLERPIYYTVEVTKPVTFTMTYYDRTTDTTYVILKEDGTPFRVTPEVTLSSTFSYWDSDNGCPALSLPGAIYTKEMWSNGELRSNYDWTSSIGLDCGPGMDFELGAPLDETSHDIVAIEVTKYVQGMFGTGDQLEVRTLTLSDSTECDINVYQNNSTTSLHKITLPIGTNGMGTIYDYGVTVSKDKYNPATASISEEPDTVIDELYDADGKKWTYHHSYIKTEYAWRNNGNQNPSYYYNTDSPFTHDATYYLTNGYTKEDELYYSASEVLGDYYVEGGIPYTYKGVDYNGKDEYNRFLEFYVYNIYEPVKYPVFIKKVDANLNATGLAGAEFDLYGPYDSERSGDTADQGGRKETKFNTEGTIKVEESDGVVKIGDLSDGIYYLYETKAPDGYLMLTEPLEITVNSANEGTETSVVIVDSDKYTVRPVPSDPNNQQEPYYEITIPNTPGIVLPETGGKGTTVFCLLGGGLILAAGLLLARRKKYIA